MRNPKGVRLNNPGNIEKGDPWQGLVPNQIDELFCTFKSAKWGIRAIAVTLMTYKDKYGINTVFTAINRWAPPSDNNPTEVYANFVADKCGVRPGDEVDLTDYKIMYGLVTGIIAFENARYEYPDQVVREALHLAGIECPATEIILKKSRTVKATAAVTAAGVAPIMDVIPQIKSAISPLVQYSDYFQYALSAVTIIGAALIIYAYIDDKRKAHR